MDKKDLKGRYISYFHLGQREGKVVKIVGNTLTVKNAYGERKRLHPDKYRIFGVYVNKKLEEIQWN